MGEIFKPSGVEGIRYIEVPQILDGQGSTSLEAGARTYKFESGDILIAGTDKGIDYMERNEDRVVVSPEANLVVVIDGVGGLGIGEGETSAKILAENLFKLPQNIDKAVEEGTKEMEDRKIGRHAKSVFISARINVEKQNNESKKFLEVSQKGDSRVFVIKKDGTIGFRSVDQSLVQEFVEKGDITPDQALYHGVRNLVTACVSYDRENKEQEIKKYEKVLVEKGDLVFAMSDGISDNITPEEIAQKVKEGLSALELFAWISDETDKRMQNEQEIIKNTPNRAQSGVYADGYKSKPKRDNRALAILEIK